MITQPDRGEVLVVEDNHLTRALLRTVLAAEGYGVLEAVTAAEGVEAARHHRPGLVISNRSVRAPCSSKVAMAFS
jgi:CheY-like chemotaxis protein